MAIKSERETNNVWSLFRKPAPAAKSFAPQPMAAIAPKSPVITDWIDPTPRIDPRGRRSTEAKLTARTGRSSTFTMTALQMLGDAEYVTIQVSQSKPVLRLVPATKARRSTKITRSKSGQGTVSLSGVINALKLPIDGLKGTVYPDPDSNGIIVDFTDSL